MASTYSSAIAALLNNGSKQVLPISMANLIELAANKEKFGTGAQSVQDALGYLAGSFEHANTIAKNEADRAESNAYAYVGQEINKLNAIGVGSATDAGHDKFISYIYQEDGKIKAFAQDMTAENVAYSGSDGRLTVDAELQHINATIADNLTATTLKLVHTVGADENVVAESVTADGTEYRLKQGKNVVAKFNIEKDSFVKNGAVVRGTLAEGGTFTESANGQYYIKLEIRTNDEGGNAERTLYIPAESLVDAYTANNGDGNGNSVTVTVDSTKNTISAVIKEGGVGTKELADSAVTTVKIANSAVTTDKIAASAVTAAKIDALAVTTEKIATSAVTNEKIATDAVETAKIKDKNVTKAKLEDTVQTSLGKADSAVQTITTGTEAGTIAVDGKDVKVKDIKAIATTGAAADVTVATIDNLDALTTLGEGKHVDDVQEALAVLAGKVKAINDGVVTSVKASVVDNGKDTQNAVTISMTPVDESKGAVEVQLTHNLGSAAALDYDMKNVATPVSQAFWESVK